MIARAVGAFGFQGPHDVQAAPVAELEIDHGKRRRARLDGRQAFGDAHRHRGGEAARRHGSREPVAKGLVVIHDQQRPVGRRQIVALQQKRVIGPPFLSILGRSSDSSVYEIITTNALRTSASYESRKGPRNRRLCAAAP